MTTMPGNASGLLSAGFPVWAGWAIAAALLLLMFVVYVVTFGHCFVKIGPNQALVVSGRPNPRMRDENGKPRRFRIVKGGGTFVWPMIEKYDLLVLELFPVELRGIEVRTAAGERLRLDAVAMARIGDDDESLQRAAVQLLSMRQEEIAALVRALLEGALAKACEGLTAKDIAQGGDALEAAVGRQIGDALAAMGVRLDSLVLRNIRDAGVGRADTVKTA